MGSKREGERIGGERERWKDGRKKNIPTKNVESLHYRTHTVDRKREREKETEKKREGRRWQGIA